MDNSGKFVRVHYIATLDNGLEIESTYKNHEPLAFYCGKGEVIKGFDEAVMDMEAGQIKEVRLAPNEAYGESDPALIKRVSKSGIPRVEYCKVGSSILVPDEAGMPRAAKILEIGDDDLLVDFNDKMKGKYLNLKIEMLSVER